MKKLIYVMAAVTLIAGFNSCKKKADQPPVPGYTEVKNFSVPELKAIAASTVASQREFKSDVYFSGVVLADDVTGNFYKEVYVRDRYNTGAIRLDLLSSSCNLFVGDSVRLNLNGYDVSYNVDTGMLEVDSIDCEKAITKYSVGGPKPEPIPVELTCVNYANYLCDLIKIEKVSFIPGDANQIWADPISQLSKNRVIQDCGGNQLIVRTSNYAKFAMEKTPSGAGSMIGIATAYTGTNQIVIRTPAEADMNGPISCNLYHKKDWEDNILTSGGWSQQSVVDPAVLWTSSTFGGKFFAKISGFYSSTNHNSENWLISPTLNLSSATNPVLTFVTAAKFTGQPLEVWVSTNYSSGAPSSASWTQLSGFGLSPNNPGNYAWTSSCLVDLSAYKSANTRIAFKYTSTTAGSTTYEVDDVIIREK